MIPQWDTKGEPPAPLPAVGEWSLEARPLSWFRGWHAVKDRVPDLLKAMHDGAKLPVVQAYDDGLLRDGHHRVQAAKLLTRDTSHQIPVWVLKRNVEVNPKGVPVQLDRTKAPAGGMIVNRQFHTGGQFLPTALKAIRRVLEIRRGRKSSGETPTQEAAFLAALGPILARVAGSAGGAVAGAGARGAAGAGARGAATGGGRLGAMDILSMMPAPSPPRKEEDKSKMAKNSEAALTSFLPAEELIPGTPRRTFTDAEVRRIEDAHGLEEHERLPRTVDGKTGVVTSNLNDYYDWQDRLAKKRLGPKLHAVLNDPGTHDDIKMAHLTNHILADAGEVMRRMSADEADRWYGSTVSDWEVAMHHMLSRRKAGDPASPHIPDSPTWGTFDPKTKKILGSKPYMRLAKAVLAFTSGSATPTINSHAAYRLIHSGSLANPSNPFTHLPEKDHGRYQDWLASARQALGLPHTSAFEKISKEGSPAHQRLADAVEWDKTYGSLLRRAKVAPGYSQIHLMSNRETGEPVALIPFQSGASLRPLPGKTQEEVDHLRAQKKLRPVAVPLVGESGHLTPLGWGKRGSVIKAAANRLGRLVGELGPEGAADFLENPQPLSALKKYNPSMKLGGAVRGAKMPGAFIFGPKFGPFFLNLSGKKDQFTLDSWMSRLAYSYLGTVLDSKMGRAEGPRTEADSRIIAESFRRAASKLNVPPADLQAITWDMAQRTPNLFGVSHAADDFRAGGRDLLGHHGFDPSILDPGGVLPGATGGGRGNPPDQGSPAARSAKPRARKGR